ERHQRRVLIHVGDEAALELVCAQRVANGVDLLQRGMIGGQFRDVRFEINVMRALVGVGFSVHGRLDLLRGGAHVIVLYEAFEAEHAIAGQRGTSVVDQGVPFPAAWAVQRIALKIDDGGSSSMKRLPPLNAVRTFEVAARLASFVAAGKELGVSAAAVSQQVRHLEEYFGKKLFVRSGNRLSLTDAGLAIFPQTS
nr:hypothetical protein [Tanacetum cinerariifolium]